MTKTISLLLLLAVLICSSHVNAQQQQLPQQQATPGSAPAPAPALNVWGHLRNGLRRVRGWIRRLFGRQRTDQQQADQFRTRAQAQVARIQQFRQNLVGNFAQNGRINLSLDQNNIRNIIERVVQFAQNVHERLNTQLSRFSPRVQQLIGNLNINIDRQRINQLLQRIEAIRVRIYERIRQILQNVDTERLSQAVSRFLQAMRRVISRLGNRACDCVRGDTQDAGCTRVQEEVQRRVNFNIQGNLAQQGCRLFTRVLEATQSQTESIKFLPISVDQPLPEDDVETFGDVVEEVEVLIIFLLLAVCGAITTFFFCKERKTHQRLLANFADKV